MSQHPFRWSLVQRSQLGSLLDGEVAEDYSGFFAQLRECSVRVMAAAGDGNIVFVGRSPESLFDYLTGILGDTSWSERITLLNFSMRYDEAEALARTNGKALAAIHEQMEALHITPAEIASGERPIVFADIVSQGDTFGRLLGLIEHWAVSSGVDVAAVRRRIRFLGITVRSKNSPNTWRWYQQVDWAARMPRRSLSSISIPFDLWGYLGEWQKKVARWNPPMWWGAEALAEPPRDKDHLEALRLAYSIYSKGCENEERRRFATGLAARPEMREAGIRALVMELRR